MIVKRSCNWCSDTGLNDKGFCHICNGQGYQEVVKKANVISGTKEINIEQLIVSISEFTTPEQLSNIMSHYLQKTHLDY